MNRRFSDSTLDAIREQTVDIIGGRYVELKRSGNSFKSLCPFHSEKTASFTVSTKGFSCFGCGRKGDVFSFLMQIENVTFPRAVEIAATHAGIHLINGARTVETTNAVKRRIAARALVAWRNAETGRFGEELRRRDRLARTVGDMVNDGSLNEDAAWSYFELAFKNYSEIEHHWKVLLNGNDYPDTLKLWRESRTA